MKWQTSFLHALHHSILARARRSRDDDQQRLRMMDIECGIGGGSHLQIVPDGLNLPMRQSRRDIVISIHPKLTTASVGITFPTPFNHSLKEDIRPLHAKGMTYTMCA
jgi:hypothetical protein